MYDLSVGRTLNPSPLTHGRRKALVNPHSLCLSERVAFPLPDRPPAPPPPPAKNGYDFFIVIWSLATNGDTEMQVYVRQLSQNKRRKTVPKRLFID